ncbi:MAG: hypothetical protein HYU88_12710, partial [Chloroflexi bacterium]|nr:hypothetical protein [Chloroflexota bacterium]
MAKLALGAAPAPQPSVTFTPPAVPQGGTVAVSGGGFSTSAFSTSALTATVRLVDSAVTTSTVATLGTAALRGRGSFSSVPLTVPVTAPVGVYRVQATDGVLTATSVATLTVTAVTPPPSVWQQLTAQGAAGSPVGRYGHAAAWDGQQNRLLVFGGWGGNVYRNDLWVWSASGGWQELTAQGAAGSPVVRREHAAAWHSLNNRLLVFGGLDTTNN